MSRLSRPVALLAAAALTLGLLAAAGPASADPSPPGDLVTGGSFEGIVIAPGAAEASQPPIPGWKQTDWARDVLPAGDPAGAEPRREVEPSDTP